MCAARYCTGFAGPPSYALSYGAGFYHSISLVGFASDAFIDLIPVDTVSTLIMTAAAAALVSGPYAADTAKVYHAASAARHPYPATTAYETLNKFWVANPCPGMLPFSRWVTQHWRWVPYQASSASSLVYRSILIFAQLHSCMTATASMLLSSGFGQLSGVRPPAYLDCSATAESTAFATCQQRC